MSIINDDRFPRREYDKLVKYVDGNLNDLTNDDGFCIPSSLDKVFIEFLEKILLLTRETDIDLLEECDKTENQNLFWETLGALVKQNNIPYEETEEIRNLTHDIYEKCVKDVFEKYIIYNDDVAKNKWLKEQDIVILIKLINFCINSVIVKRYSMKDFVHFADIMFGLESEKIKVLWDIIQENKKELQVNYIISKLDELTALSSDND